MPPVGQPYTECPQELLQVQHPAAVTVPSPAHTLCLSHVQRQPQLSQALLKLPRIQGPAPVPVQAAEKPTGKGRSWRVIPGAKWSGTGEGTAHLARPWMPEAPRDRHCPRSLSTVASTVSMLGSGSLGSWLRQRSSGCPARLARLQAGRPLLTHLALSVLESSDGHSTGSCLVCPVLAVRSAW